MWRQVGRGTAKYLRLQGTTAPLHLRRVPSSSQFALLIRAKLVSQPVSDNALRTPHGGGGG